MRHSFYTFCNEADMFETMQSDSVNTHAQHSTVLKTKNKMFVFLIVGRAFFRLWTPYRQPRPCPQRAKVLEGT